jgi:hypothetical protein
MRTLSILALLLLGSAILKAQLKNTQWKGKMYVPSETKVILDFKEDSVDMIIVDYNGMVGETMTYSVKDSVITMKKTSGNSPCNVGDEFKVKYLIQDDKLFISNLSDPCDARIHCWSDEPLIRVNE